MSVLQEHNIDAAHRVYGDWNRKQHNVLNVPSWIVHVILVKAFRFRDDYAGQVVNDLISEARMRSLNTPAVYIFTTSKGRGNRKWVVSCVFLPFESGSRFSIREVK